MLNTSRSGIHARQLPVNLKNVGYQCPIRRLKTQRQPETFIRRKPAHLPSFPRRR
ncbi:hypothetical protein HMPREF9120_02822, partial [Neisseria sp. oral taxon 020 str. F0370]